MLCIMPLSLKAGDSIDGLRDEWINDIRFFKEKCRDKPKYVDATDPALLKKKNSLDM